MAKCLTPEICLGLINAIKSVCVESAPKMVGEIVEPDGYAAPKIDIVKASDLMVNGEASDKKLMFFIGQLFVAKDVLKKLFSIRYGEIDFGGVTKAAWYVECNSITEDPSNGVEAWLKGWGWEVDVDDLDDDEDED